MSLPLVFDIATGLIFIYLILSLLTSEVQEIVATLLQWRAEHLKKSIEILLTGNVSRNLAPDRFSDELYNSPLIRSLNQEAKGPIARAFRAIIHRLGDLYRFTTRTKNTFGAQRSGPSYIPAEAFSAALLQKLDLETISQKVSEFTLRKFSQEKIAFVQEVINALREKSGDDALLENEIVALRRNLTEIYDDLINRRTTLAVSIDNATAQLIQFIDNTSLVLGDDDNLKDIVRQRLPYLRQSIVLRKLEPTISEVMSFILNQNQNLPPQLVDAIARLQREKVELPEQLKQSLISLSKQAQIKAEGLEQGVRQLEQEVETWFDRSMERASGVYRRNSKGIAIVIGFAIALATNADTLHIVGRLSKDTLLRSTVSQAANQVVAQTVPSNSAATSTPQSSASDSAPTETLDAPIDNSQGTLTTNSAVAPIQQDLENVKNAVNNVLEDLPLPVGWNDVNLQQQALESQGWAFPYLRRFIGWFVSGIALSMGASFWFDLLSKVVRVRGSGRPPQHPSSDTNSDD